MKKNKKKIISFFLTAVLCMNIILPDITVIAEETSNTIYIGSAKDLISLAKKSSLDTWSQGKTVVLTNDVDLTGTEFTSIPIFAGTFDGQGHTISGLSLTDYNSPQGLFRYIQEGALVKNLTIKGTVTPIGIKSTIGGVAGSNSGTILNCIFIGTIRGDKYVGGIAGINEAEGLISNSSAQGIVYGKHYVGGIAGQNLGAILLSNNEANVNTTVTENTLNLEDIQNIDIDSFTSLSTADVIDITDVGGIAGISSGIIQSCTNYGTVGYQHVGYNIGGIVGRQSGYLNGCTNKGSVYGRKDVGGIAGQIEPYATWQLSEDSLAKLRKELNTLQTMINNAINDSNHYSSEITAGLSTTLGYVDDANAAGDSLMDQTASWLNTNIDNVNNISARVTQTLVALEPIMDSVSRSANDMETAIGQYKDAMQQLESAADSAETGMDTIYPALDEMQGALNDIADAVNVISASLTSLKAGLGDSRAVEDALSNMQAGITDLIKAIGKISDAASTLLDATDILVKSQIWNENVPLIQEGANELVFSANKMADAIESISNALTALKGDFDEEELSAALNSLESAVANLTIATEKSVSGLSKIASGLEKLANGYVDNEETQQAWQDIENGLKMVEEAIGDDSDIDYEAVLQGLNMILSGLTVLIDNTDITAIQEGLMEIYEGVQDLANATEDIQVAVSGLQDMIDHLQAVNTDPEQTEKNLEALMQGFADLAVATQDASAALLKINTALNNLLQSDEVKTFGKALVINLHKISDEVSNAINAMEIINTEAERLSKQIDLDNLSKSIDYLRTASSDISKALVHMQSAISYMRSAWTYFEKSSDSASKAISSAIKATDTFENSVTVMADAITEMHALISDLAAQPKITFQKLDSNYMETKDELSAALGNISSSLSGLNDTLSGASDTLLADIQSISNQMFVVFNLLVGAVEDVTEISTDIRDYTEDISTEDTDSDTGGKVADSINHGVIQGDVNVGGISGSIAIEYDFDLEDDHNLTEKMSPDSKYQLRAIVSGCENFGNITSKKNHVGGIVGLMDFGYVLQSIDNGSISSTSGDYIGGIAGKSDGTIRESYAKSSLSGYDYIGGIVGYGADIYDSFSLIRVEKAHEFIGTIAGNTDGVLQGNYFVHDELAAVNGISYSGKAEPISYEELLLVEGLPTIFKTFHLTFVSDDKEIASILFEYGGTIPENQIPDIPDKDGYFGEWDMVDFTNLTFDETIEAVYTRYITTLASTQTRDRGSSVILVDGLFTTNSSMMCAEAEGTDSFKGEQVIEQWTISITDDGQAYHTVRYLTPDRQTSGINIYLLKDGTWQKTDYTTKGSYLLFDMDGIDATFIITSSENNTVIIILSILSILLGIITFIWLRRRRNPGSSIRSLKRKETRR